MQLLVSVADASEARAALLGGADVIDAKDPRRGALGAVGPGVLRAVRDVVHPHRPVSAALGDAGSEAAVARAAEAAAAVGVAFVKLGFRGVTTAVRARRAAVAARRGASQETGVVLVAYADWRRAESLAPRALVDVAAAAGVAGVLLDTAIKDAVLFALLHPAAVEEWVGAAHAAGLFAALAGSLRGGDFSAARELGADIVGVRGAACVGGRTGRVSRARVAALRALADAASPPRPLTGRGVLPERDVELPEIVDGDDEVLYTARERAEEGRVDELDWVGGCGLDQHDAPRADLAREPGGDAVARDVPGMWQRIRGPKPAVWGEY